MKRLRLIIVSMSLFQLVSAKLYAQTVSDFENLTLPAESFFNGSSQQGGTNFIAGNATFPNFFDPSFQYWLSGWAYSNVADSSTAGFGNMYACASLTGYNGSGIYAIGQQNATITLSGSAAGKVVNGFYVTNATYPYISMRDGDGFSKKFGGPSGNDPDYFILTIHNWYNGNLSSDSVNFYLADFRFTNNAQDYIINDWQWVDLTGLGNTDSLLFTLSSSDVGSFGINTPLFYCIDNLTTADSPVAISEIKNDILQVYPNPATSFILLTKKMDDFFITDVEGRVVMKSFNLNAGDKISVTSLKDGLYFINGQYNNESIKSKFIKCSAH